MDAKEWLKEVYFPKKRIGEEMAELVKNARSIIESQNREIEMLCKQRDEVTQRAERAEAEAAAMREALRDIIFLAISLKNNMLDDTRGIISNAMDTLVLWGAKLPDAPEEANNDQR